MTNKEGTDVTSSRCGDQGSGTRSLITGKATGTESLALASKKATAGTATGDSTWYHTSLRSKETEKFLQGKKEQVSTRESTLASFFKQKLRSLLFEARASDLAAP